MRQMRQDWYQVRQMRQDWSGVIETQVSVIGKEATYKNNKLYAN